MTRGDALVILLAAVLVAGAYALLWSPATPATQVRIVSGEREIARLPLDEPRRLEVSGPAGITVVEIRDGAARCAVSPGARGICQRAGWLREAGDMAVSLPNRVIIEVLGETGRFDSINY
ncbi:MAG: NusG domain II-containing protein [Ectothiorhodospira sp.]